MLSKENEQILENEHVLKMWTPFSITMDENYEFVKRDTWFEGLSTLVYLIVLPLITCFHFVCLGFRMKGIEHLKEVKGKGKITISNHIHVMDCTLVSSCFYPSMLYFPTIKSNFEIPVIRWIIKLLKAIPIPDKLNAKKKFAHTIDGLLQENKTVHFYPEASMWPYHDKIRNFKKGAFEFACRNNVPIVPMVYTYHKATGILGYFKKKPCVTLHILKAIYPDCSLEHASRVNSLKNQAFSEMECFMLQNNNIG